MRRDISHLRRDLLAASVRMRRVPRRTFLAGLAFCGLAAATGRAEPIALKAAARKRGLFWGAAVQHAQLKNDAAFAALVAQQCSAITPEWEMKWAAIESHRGKPNFARADAIASFAREHQLGVRGHALIWHRSVPDWAREAMRWDDVGKHIETMLRRYRAAPFICWDVLNEVIEPKDRREDGLRISPFLKAFGPDYINRALALSRATAPDMKLYINEYGLDYDGPVERARRATLLKLIETLRKSNVPFDGIGIQGHLRLDNSPFSAATLRKFLADLASHNLKITITELDVRERNLSLPQQQRDRLVAAEVKRYLDVVLDEPAVEGIVAWGLSDRYSWLSPKKLTDTGQRNRGLPFDQALAAKPVRDEIVAALERRPH
jgi:endo-1,4-beta-xylanase